MSYINHAEIDMNIAIQLQAQFDQELRSQREEEEKKVKSLEKKGHRYDPTWKDLPEPEQEKLAVSLADPSWDFLDPNPNIFDLFLTFNHQFFWGRLQGVEVKWSPRMTVCAGICSYEGRGGLCSVRLSIPLLKLRPRKDLIETLLHEMIHAYLFVTHNNTDHDGHGPQFHRHMYRLNKLAGTSISVYHSFHNEVAVYRQHVWQCQGPCRSRPPYYGLVKRSMNRAPSETDFWWSRHVQICGGTYVKIKEPEGFKDKKKAKSKGKPGKDIRSYFPPNSLSGGPGNAPRSAVVNGRKIIKGISNPGSQSVGRVGVQNAINANVNGFGASKKSGNPGTGLRGGVASGSRGSRTVVVKGKKGLSENGRTDSANDPNFVPFSGGGHSLGSTNTGGARSRLLSQFEPGKRKRRPGPALASDDGKVCCPMCQRVVWETEFDEHLEDCLGNFDSEDFRIEDVEQGSSEAPLDLSVRGTSITTPSYLSNGGSSATAPPRRNLSNAPPSSTFGISSTTAPSYLHNRGRSTTALPSSSVAGNFTPATPSSSVEGSSVTALSSLSVAGNSTTTSPSLSVAGVSTVNLDDTFSSSDDDEVLLVEDEIPLYPCPVCHKRYPENEINKHANVHFSEKF